MEVKSPVETRNSVRPGPSRSFLRTIRDGNRVASERGPVRSRQFASGMEIALADDQATGPNVRHRPAAPRVRRASRQGRRSCQAGDRGVRDGKGRKDRVTMPGFRMAMLSNARFFWWPALFVVAAAACASGRAARLPELSGTSSPTGCDAWFEIGGTFSRLNDVRYVLRNRSTGPECPATRVVVLFSGQLRPAAFRVSAPPGWTRHVVPCEKGGGVCGFEWRARHGVLPEQPQPG